MGGDGEVVRESLQQASTDTLPMEVYGQAADGIPDVLPSTAMGCCLQMSLIEQEGK